MNSVFIAGDLILFAFPTSAKTVEGNNKIAIAKIIGITPPGFNLNGMNEFIPPYTLLPICLFGLTMITLRTASCIITIKTVAAKNIDSNINNPNCICGLAFTSIHVLEAYTGIPDKIPQKMISEPPLPIPFSVINSDIHITRTAPAVNIQIEFM